MGNKKVNLKFTLQDQKETNWCWSAIGTSCALAYMPASNWTQCKLASKCLEKPCCGNAESDSCNEVWPLENDLHQGALITAQIANGFKKEPIPFGDLVAQIDAGFVVAYLIEYIAIPGYFYHFVAVTGYSIVNGKEYVRVQDSLFQDTDRIEYTRFITKFYNQFKVIATYFTKGEKKIEKEITPVTGTPIIPPGPISLGTNKNLGTRGFNNNNNMENETLYQVYRANWEDILKDQNLEKAFKVGERFFQADETSRLSAYEVDSDDAETGRSVKFGRMVEEHKQISDKYKDSDDFKGLEHSLLKLEILSITTVWYRASNRANRDLDKFVPLKPCFNGIVAGQVYSASEFLSILVREAKKVQEKINRGMNKPIL